MIKMTNYIKIKMILKLCLSFFFYIFFSEWLFVFHYTAVEVK